MCMAWDFSLFKDQIICDMKVRFQIPFSWVILRMVGSSLQEAHTENLI